MGAKYLRNITKILKSASGVLYGRATAGTGRGEELTPADVRTLISFDESVDDRVSALLAAGTNITIAYNDAANTLTIASTAGGLSGTGSVDNAALRADGTGGATLQNSSWIINDNLTASPNNTVNHACLEATGGTTNVSVSVKPKGSGAFCLSAPDGTANGGNVRGANAVDLQTLRSSASQVASGDGSFLSAGYHNTVSGTWSGIVGGALNTVTGIESFIGGGEASDVSGQFSAVISGRSSKADGSNALAIGFAANARLLGMFAHSSCPLNLTTGGESQAFRLTMGVKTTDATPTTLWLDRSALNRLTVLSGYVMMCVVNVVGIKSDGSQCAVYRRRVAIKNVGGTTSLVGSVEVIGTDIEDDAAYNLLIDRDDTNDCLAITVTGVGTMRWFALIDGLEFKYGT